MVKKLFLVLGFFLIFFCNFQNAQAVEQKDIVLVNPIRGLDFWNNNLSLIETPKNQYELIKKNNFSSSWLVRYDALVNSEVQGFLKSLDSKQDIGLFFEITPTFTKDAGVVYNKSENWHFAKSVLLTGYSPDDRIKLIDTAVKEYNELFGKNPKSVGAWWIDAYSLSYLKDKYGIEANLDVADQYMTDGYQVWGQYWSIPFYPSKVNALMPAQSKEQKLDVVTMQWATRDPFNGYGNGVFESTYSVQGNDYLLHDLDINYFPKLLDIYPQTTVGLENDFAWGKYGKEYEAQIEVIAQKQKQNKLQVKNMVEFSEVYKKLNPEISPNVLIVAEDPLGSGGKVVWLNTPKYRLGWFANSQGSVVRDLRKYNDRAEEMCLKRACDELKLALGSLQAIDDGNYSSSWILDEGMVSDIKVKQLPFGVEISYNNQAGTQRVLKFLENDVEFAGQINTLDVAILKAVTQENPTKINSEQFLSKFDWGANLKKIILNTLKFILLVAVFFFIPGFALTKSKVLSIPVGIVLFTLLCWIFGYFRLDYFIWILPVLGFAGIGVQNRLKFSLPKINKQSLILTLIVVLGSASWMVTQFKNGLLFNYGYGFWGPNGHDGIWHLALISQLQKNVPPSNPIFAGESLSNYHYFFDLLVAKSANVLSIDSVDLLFRLFPLLISLLAGILIFKVSQRISSSFWAGIFSVFFLYFAGSFGWVLTYLKDKSFAGETMFWAQQSISTLLNPPFAISIILLLSGFLIFYHFRDSGKRELGLWISLTLLWGSLIEFKAYAGLLVVGALGLYSLQRILLKRDFKILLLLIPVLVLSFAVFLPNNTSSSSLIEFQPFWLVDSMVTAQDRLGWQRLTLTLQSGIWYKLLYGYGLGILIFFIGNLGTRIISLGSIKELFKQGFLIYFLILSIVLPLLFVQKGTAWNIVQFFYYGLLVLNIFAGISLYKLVKKFPKILNFGIVAAVILLTIPTTLGTFPQYLPQRPPAKVDQKELEALGFLKSQPDGVVLSLPFDEKLKNKYNPPLPLEIYTSTAYVSAFSGKDSFMEDTVNLEILGIDYKGRLNTIRDFIKVRAQASKILKENNISYVYIPKLFNYEIDENLMGLKTIYDNDRVRVYKVI